MPEFLVITTRNNIVDVADHLKSEDGVEIKVEDDFTKGLKAIFYGLPDVVFIQEEIAGITAEKVAGQVKTLLDDEPIRMVLLREQVGEWDSVAAGFDGVIDAGIPFDELLHRFREEMYAHRAPDAEAVGGAGDSTAESETLIAALDSRQEADPFFDMFPAQFHNDWSGISPGIGHDSHDEAAASRPVEAAPAFGEEFCFETPGEIVSTLPPQSPEPVLNKTLPGPAPVSSGNISDERREQRVRLTDRESPHQLFASINGGADDLSEAIPLAMDNPAAPVSDRLRLKGVSTQSSLLKTDYPTEAPPNGISASPAPKSAPPPPAAPPRARTNREDAIPRESIDMTHREGSRLRRLVPVLLLAFAGLFAYLLLDNWDGLFRLAEKDEEPLNIPRAEAPLAITTLPAFFPSVRPDPSYSALHPGWERYPGGGIDYLAYRENGVIKAMQLIAGPDGKISESFLSLCIRETTGLDAANGWTRREEGGFLVETRALGERGDAAVYRKLPEGEIRGFVLTFK